jgi:chemotaxis protein CheD
VTTAAESASAAVPPVVSVPIGRWAVAAAPTRIQTLLGSCVAVVLHDRVGKFGALAHVVLPDSRGAADHPGKYADTAIPAMLAELKGRAGPAIVGRLTAKLVGGAAMFQTTGPVTIGASNGEAAERILAGLGIPVVGRDLGGDSGRRVVFDIATGRLSIRTPAGAESTL